MTEVTLEIKSGILSEEKELNRKHELDWIRVFATLLLIPFHTAIIFANIENGLYYLNNNEVSIIMTYMPYLIYPWHMPLFFFLSGASAFFALDNQTKEEYGKSRFKRLFIPAIIGILFIVPIQQYFAMMHHRGYTGNVFESYLLFFQMGPDGITGWTGNFTISIFWFLLVLYLYTSVCLPLFVALKRKFKESIEKDKENPPLKIGWFLVPALATSLFVYNSPYRVYFLESTVFISLFIFGFIIMDKRYTKTIEKYRKISLILGLLFLFVPVSMIVFLDLFNGTGNFFLDLILFVPHGLTPWLISFALVAYGKKYYNSSNRFLKYASEASLPFYMLHMTAIIGIGFFVIQWEMDLYLKFGLICIASTILTFLVYDILVRRLNITRYLFGMKPLKKKNGLSKDKNN